MVHWFLSRKIKSRWLFLLLWTAVMGTPGQVELWALTVSGLCTQVSKQWTRGKLQHDGTSDFVPANHWLINPHLGRINTAFFIFIFFCFPLSFKSCVWSKGFSKTSHRILCSTGALEKNNKQQDVIKSFKKKNLAKNHFSIDFMHYILDRTTLFIYCHI